MDQRYPGVVLTFTSRRAHWLVLFAPYAWLIIFCAVPIALVMKISLAEPILAQPPFTPLFDGSEFGGVRLSFNSYARLGQDEVYISALANAFRVAGISTVLCLLAGFPVAYAITRVTPGFRICLLVLVAVPFWTAFLIRVYAWMGLLGNHGLINGLLQFMGGIEAPIVLLHTELAVHIGIAYVYLPFMIFPLYVNLSRINPMIVDAARDLGANPIRVFGSVIFPLSLPGVAAGCILVFVPAVGEFVIPTMLGGADSLMIGQILWDEFFVARNWTIACRRPNFLLLITALTVTIWHRGGQKNKIT